jgi:hypothetical protein
MEVSGVVASVGSSVGSSVAAVFAVLSVVGEVEVAAQETASRLYANTRLSLPAVLIIAVMVCLGCLFL